ncbi:MAG: 50S ribosomal protein L3 [Candidatus Omnitrophota bacterium]
MIREIYGKKIGMTQVFSESGRLLAVTLLDIEPVYILEKVTYSGKIKAKIGCFKIEGKKVNKIKKPIKGYFDKMGSGMYKLVREVEVEKNADFSWTAIEPQELKPEEIKPEEAKLEETKPEEVELKDNNIKELKSEDNNFSQDEQKQTVDPRQIGIEIFREGETVDVRAKSKGKGFAGGMKRYGWKGQPASHGSTSHRRIGSAGSSSDPSKIIKGLHMPGHMGDKFRTAKNLKVLRVDKEKNILFIEGSMPGSKGAVVRIKKI